MRGKEGKFGVDHSEILNYELEIANKERDDHMNQLTYKVQDPYGTVQKSVPEKQWKQDFVNDRDLNVFNKVCSKVLYKRLSVKPNELKNSDDSTIESDDGENGNLNQLDFN